MQTRRLLSTLCKHACWAVNWIILTAEAAEDHPISHLATRKSVAVSRGPVLRPFRAKFEASEDAADTGLRTACVVCLGGLRPFLALIWTAIPDRTTALWGLIGAMKTEYAQRCSN